MIIASVKEDNTSLLLGDAKASLKSSPMGSSPNSLNGQPPDSPSVPAIFTDVNVVPEQDKNQLEQLIANLEGEILQLRQKQNLFDKKRREALNKLLDMKGSIRVFCRVRPYLMTSRRKIREPISTGSEMIVVRSSGIRKEFNFDKVFPQEASQEEIFVEIAPLLRSALDGHHVSILAFGQTGTGKTFTMDGTNDQIGIIPRALEELFSQASLDKSSSLKFSMSMLEVYMGNLRDLLSPKPPYRAYEASTRYNLNIQTDPKGLVEIEGLTEVQIPDFGKARWWYNKGKRVRSTSWTNVNEASSRSHCLTRITVFRRGDALEANTEVSKLWMVDLGGSERLLKTGATGQTLDEGRAINLSISALGDVIAALKRKRGHVPYRNSKLTQILKDSLGDGSKVLMLVHVSPCEEDVGETICSLNFAKRARAVESVKELPEELKKHRERRIVELEKDMREAEEEIQKITKQIQTAEFLLSENKKLFSTPNKSFEAAEKNLQGPNEDLKEVIRTTQKSEKASRRSVGSSLPRFMTSTVASRQRQSIAEREIVGKVTSLQSGTRSSVQLSGSQSLSFSDFRFKSIVRSSNKKTRHGEMNAFLTVSPKCKDLDLKVPSLPRSKMVTSSDPNLRVTLCRHKRRMSDFI